MLNVNLDIPIFRTSNNLGNNMAKIKLTNKWRVSARITPELNRSLNDFVDWLKEKEPFKVRGRSVRREHVIQLALIELLSQDKNEAASRISAYVSELESSCS